MRSLVLLTLRRLAELAANWGAKGLKCLIPLVPPRGVEDNVEYQSLFKHHINNVQSCTKWALPDRFMWDLLRGIEDEAVVLELYRMLCVSLSPITSSDSPHRYLKVLCPRVSPFKPTL